MEEIVKTLDKKLEYESHEIQGDTIYIRVKSNRREVTCPYCGRATGKVHSRYERSCQDLRIAGKKVIIEIQNRKMICITQGAKTADLRKDTNLREQRRKRASG